MIYRHHGIPSSIHRFSKRILHSCKYENDYIKKLLDLERSQGIANLRFSVERYDEYPVGRNGKNDGSESLRGNNVPARGKTSFVICYRFARVLYFLRACERRGGSRPWIRDQRRPTAASRDVQVQVSWRMFANESITHA